MSKLSGLSELVMEIEESGQDAVPALLIWRRSSQSISVVYMPDGIVFVSGKPPKLEVHHNNPTLPWPILSESSAYLYRLH